MKREPVKSSNIKSIGYDPKSQTLEIEFIHGGIYNYSPVSESEHLSLMKADSVGSYFANTIRIDKSKICKKVG